MNKKTTNNIKLSVIIPTCNRNEQLGHCLDKLLPEKQTLAANQYEVIVSDDGQDYPAEAFCSEHYPWVCYTRGPRRGPAANRNCGARIASGDWLVFTDDDCLPDAGWLQAYANAIHQYPECKAFEGAILPDDWDLLKKDMAECPVNTGGGCFWSANIAVETNFFLGLGGFNTIYKFSAQEDKELKLQIELCGNRIEFVTNASVVHPVRINNLIKSIKQAGRYHESWMIFELLRGCNLLVLYKKGFLNTVYSAFSQIKRGNIQGFFKTVYVFFRYFFTMSYDYKRLKIVARNEAK